MAAQEAQGGASGGSFVRAATGLVRQLSALDVFVWSIIFFPWLTSWSGIFWVTPAYYQNVNYYAGLLLWAGIAMVIVLLYWQLTVVMPRSGGDYIFISRTLSSPLGFIASFLFFVGVLISAGSGSYWAFAEAGTQLTFAGQVLNDGSLASLGTVITPWTTTQPWLLFALGLVVLAIGALLVVAGGRALKLVLYSFFGYGLVVMLLVVAIYLGSSHAGFVQAYSKYFPGGTAKVFSDAAAKGYSPGASLATIGVVVPLLFVSIGPYPVMQFVGGEIKHPKKSLLYGLVLAEAVSVLIWFGLTYLVDHIVGISFIEAWTLTAGGGSSTVPTAFTAVLNPSGILLWLIVIGLFIGNIGWSWLSLVFIGRLFLAWSFDRVIPTGFAHVSEKFHTPTAAIVLAAALAIVPMYLEYFTSFISAQVNGIFLYSVVWFLAALSAIVLPLRRRRFFQTASKSTIGGVPVLVVLGLLGAILFAYLGYNSALNPAIGPFAQGAQIVTAAVVAVPVIIYAVSYVHNKRRGVDLRLLHSEIPPE